MEEAIGTERDDPDSDGDGYTDAEELAHDGDQTAYSPGNDTDPLDPDTDGDGFSDLVEIAGGSDPVAAGWTAGDFAVMMSFQPREAARPAGCAVDTARPYTAGRSFGWL